MNEHENAGCPPRILEWIAWYPDGGLGDAERGAVEVHAADCAACREEIAVLTGRADAGAAPADPEQLFERVLARIEANLLTTELGAPASGSGSGSDVTRSATPPVRRAPARPRRSLSWQRRSAIAAAGIGIVALAGALGWLGREWVSPFGPVAQVEDGAIYRTASAPAPAADNGVALDVVFRNEASAERINTVLRGLGATIATGPTELGRYRLALPPGSDARAAATLLRAEGTGVASYAEPVSP